MFNRTGLDVMEKTDGRQMPWVSTTPFPDYYLAGGSPEDQNLTPTQLQPAAQTAQSSPQTSVPPQPNAGSYEIIFWESIQDSTDADAFKAYLDQYPEGAFAPLARIKLQQSASGKETAEPQPVPKETGTIHLASIDPDEKDSDIVARDGHYIKYKNGIVYDSKTGLEWVASPKGNLMNDSAKRWVSELTIDGGGWRMPSEDGLKSLYQKGKGTRNMSRLIEVKGSHFFSRDSKSWHWKGFDFQSFRPFGFRNDSSYDRNHSPLAFSALAVRSRK
jgi:hypothetical protein